MTKKINAGAIPDEVMNFALDEMQKILSGEIVFVAQDARLMQVEITQRRRLVDWSEKVSLWSEETLLTLQTQIAANFRRSLMGDLSSKFKKVACHKWNAQFKAVSQVSTAKEFKSN